MPTPPRAALRPHRIERHGDVRLDPYHWLRDREDAEVLRLLREENDYLATGLAGLDGLRERLYEEIRRRIDETDISVPVRRGSWWYFERTREGLDYPLSCRVPAAPDEPPPSVDAESSLGGEIVILDENAEAHGHDYFSVGVFEISPDDQWLALASDIDGHERHRLSFRPLGDQDPTDETIDDVYYGAAWAGDSRVFFYTRVDEAMRPYQIWRHALGTPASSDVLVYEEPDPQFTVSVGCSRDREVIVIVSASSTTSESRWLPADDPASDLQVGEPRRSGIEYGLEHAIDAAGQPWWLKLTNEDATDFRLLVGPSAVGPWRELVGHRPGTRLDGVEAFSQYLVLAERLEGSSAIRVVPLPADDPWGGDLLARSWLVEGPEQPSTVGVGANPNYETSSLRIGLTSLVTPYLVADVDLASGTLAVRKQQRVRGGYDGSAYATGRLWVTASDGQRIPVSWVARRDLLEERDGQLTPRAAAPLLLYGYGSYEISIDPTFSSIRLSLLDRGVVFAIAHVRGGGEMGRTWYEMGRLTQKPTTFSDFVAVARYLVAAGWTSPDQMAARGGSAGGLLMGAAMNLAPTLWRAVVAEVPFVDVLTTMLDPTLPLTIGEWEEWGDPDVDPLAYRTIRSYSPYDNVRATEDDGSLRRYPRLLATAGLNDSRVGYWEPAKWVQALRAANPDNEAYLKTELGAGHGGPSGRYDAWRDEALVLAFIIDSIAPAAADGGDSVARDDQGHDDDESGDDRHDGDPAAPPGVVPGPARAV
ncbi:MAG: S9 family peptidase [Acidimicrobiales bacterium]